MPETGDLENFQGQLAASRDDDKRTILQRLVDWVAGMQTEQPFITGSSRQFDRQLSNLNISQCFNCHKIAVWVHKSLIYPPVRTGAQPHPDLPADPRRDFEEARAILDLSPRGAAALLRLCVQKLCKDLGEKGRNIDDDISSLVSKGLDPVIQQALDSVRVIGNESVHPGQIDLRDDRDTALQLFDLVNDITAQTITRKMRAEQIYKRLPPEKRAAIDERNARALKGSDTA